MSLEYQIISQTTGDQDTVSQVLTQNTPGRSNTVSRGNIFSFDYPVYNLDGASFDYYNKDYNSITYDITNGKVYTMIFKENMQSLSGNNLLYHEIYRLTFDDYNSFLSDTDNLFEKTQEYFDTPILSINEYCSGITLVSDAYTYSFPTQFKNVGDFTFDIFLDKNQYFLDNLFGFYQKNDLTIGDAYYNSTEFNSMGYPVPYFLYMDPTGTTFVRSNLGTKTVTGNTPFSGMTFRGAFFTYFVPPKKPNLNVSLGRQRISVEGPQKTLSPIFNFNNTDDGDYYKLQVNYDTFDTPFSGSDIFTYTINKQAGDAEFVRTFSRPLRPNDSFIYRIGNTKEIVNVFGNKQSITTWSDTISAEIETNGQFYFSGTTWRNMIDYNYRGYYHVSGLTIGATTAAARTYTFITSADTLAASGVTATTNSVDTVSVIYNGPLYTSGWTNAIYAATGFSSMGLYILGGSSSAVTDSGMTFTFSTSPYFMSGVSLTLESIYSNNQLDLSIDLKSSKSVAVQISDTYQDSIVGQVLNRVSDSNGRFDFGYIQSGYYRLTAIPSSLAYPGYERITRFLTINSNLYIDLIFSILWGNTVATFDLLSNDTFL